MADQVNDPLYDDSIDPNLSTPNAGTPDDNMRIGRGSERTLLSLRAVNSADRLLRTLSPWIRESLTGEVSPRTSGSLIRRLMQKRRGDSFTFNGTLGIMRRFNRIVNRTVSWQANLGPIDPNLFDRFSLDMTRRRDIGANNITELLKLNRQEDALEMPLAGAPESSSPTPPNPEPARPLTLEEITKKIEAARLLRSQSPSSQPDYVQAMRKQQEAAQTPPATPSTSTLRPPQRPSSAQLPVPQPNIPTPPAPQPPTQTSAADQPNPAAMSPRTRRRMGRKVEYISMPNMEDDSADGEPSPIRQFALGPPAAPLSLSTSAPAFAFTAMDDEPPGDDSLIVNVMRKPAPRRSRVAAATSRPVQRPVARPVPAAPPIRPPRAGHRRPSIIARSVAHLSQSTSGEILASRPHSLLAHIARTPEFTPTPNLRRPLWSDATQSASMAAVIGQSSTRPVADERLQWTFPRQRTVEASLPLLLARPLHPLPTISVRRTAEPLPSPAGVLEANPVTAPLSPAPRRSRRLASPPMDIAAARQPIQRLVAKPSASLSTALLSSTPLSSTPLSPTLSPSVGQLQRDETRRRAARPLRETWADDTPIDFTEAGSVDPSDEQADQSVDAVPLATPTLIALAQPTVRRAELIPASFLWQPAPIADRPVDNRFIDDRFIADRPVSTAADNRLARAIRLPARANVATPSNWGSHAEAPPDLAHASTVAAMSPLAPSPVATWMPLEYTVQRLLGRSTPAPTVTTETSVVPTAPAEIEPRPARNTPERVPARPQTDMSRRPAHRRPAPTTLLESIVRRDFARSRAASLAEGVLPLPMPVDPVSPSPRAPSSSARTTVQRAQPTTTARTSSLAFAADEMHEPAAPLSSLVARPTGEQAAPPQPQRSPQPPTASVPQPTVPDPTRSQSEAHTSSAPGVLPALPALRADRLVAPATTPVIQSRRTAILSQTLRHLAQTASPDAPLHRATQRLSLQRSGERVRPARSLASAAQVSLRPGFTALDSLLLSQTTLAAQRLPSSAQVWTQPADPAQTVPTADFDNAARGLPANLPQDWATLLSPRVDMPAPAPVDRGSAAQSVQRQASFAPLELALRQLNRTFAPVESTPAVQPTNFAPPSTPTIQRRIAQRPTRTSTRPRSVTARPVVASDVAVHNAARLRATPARRPHAVDKPPTPIRPATSASPGPTSTAVDAERTFAQRSAPPTANVSVAQLVPSSSVRRADESSQPALTSARVTQPDRAEVLSAAAVTPSSLVDQILARDFSDLRRSLLGRNPTIKAPSPLPNAAADTPASSPRRFADRETSDTPARIQRREHAPRSWRTRREWTRQLRRDLLPSLPAVTEHTSPLPNRPIAQSLTPRRSPGSEVIQPHSSVALDNYPVSPFSSTAVIGRSRSAFPLWLTPPVSAAWPTPQDDPSVAFGAAFGTANGLPSLQRRMADPVSVAAHSQSQEFDPLPQAPFARHFWLHSQDAPNLPLSPEPSPIRAQMPVRSAARPLVARTAHRHAVSAPLDVVSSSPGDGFTRAESGTDRATGPRSGQQGVEPTLDERLPLRRLRAVTTLIQSSAMPSVPGQTPTTASTPSSTPSSTPAPISTTQTPSVQRSAAQTSSAQTRTARTPTDTILAQTPVVPPAFESPALTRSDRSSPQAQRMTPVEEGDVASTSAVVRRLTPSHRRSRVRPLVEGVVARSFGDSRRRMLATGPSPLATTDVAASPSSGVDTFAGEVAVDRFSAPALSSTTLSAPVTAENIERLTGSIPTPSAPDLPLLARRSVESTVGERLQLSSQATPLPPLVLRQLPVRTAPPTTAPTETSTSDALTSQTLPVTPKLSPSSTLPMAQRLPTAQSAATAQRLSSAQGVPAVHGMPTAQDTANAPAPRRHTQKRGARLTQTLLDLSAADFAAHPEFQIGLPKPPALAKQPMLGSAPVEAAPSTLQRAPTAQQPFSSAPTVRRQMRLRPGTVARQVAAQATARRSAAVIEPASMAWRAALLRDVADPKEIADTILSTRTPAATPSRADDGARVEASTLWRGLSPQSTPNAGAAGSWLPPAQAAHFVPLELALQRLLVDRPAPTETTQTADVAPPVTPERVLQRMEAGGWRFKRQQKPAPQDTAATARSLHRLARPAAARPLPAAPRTLLERVLHRDFAGVRVQAASLGALGVEAAAKDDTVYLSPAAARLDSAESLALLGHELTHVAARLPLKVQRESTDPLPDLPLTAPSLTRQLSQRLVQMSLAEEESTAARVESTVRRAARGRSAPALQERPLATARLAQRKVDGRRFTPSTALWFGDGAPLLPPESALPSSLVMPKIERGSSGSGGSEQIISSVIRPDPPNPLDPRSIQRTPADLTLLQPDRGDRAAQPANVLESMQSQGWRFKRTRNGAPVGDVQAATQTAQSLSAGRAMPLPLQPRSLLERVLQRDFSGVRMQVAGLEPLGVEAAARGNTVVVQRETAANLHRPENLALLGHELTHVAAAGHAPVQRTSATSATSPQAYTQGNAVETPLVQRTLSPALPVTRSSVATEERIADQVETHIRRMPDVQRVALAPNPSAATPTSPLNLPLSPLPKRARLATELQRAPALPPALPSMLDVQRSLSAELSPPTPAVIQRKPEGESSALSGVERTSMPVAQRYHVPVRRSSAEDDPGSAAETTPATASPPSFGEKITITAPRVQRDGEAEADSSTEEEKEPDWAQLAEKIYPLLKDRLLSERDRLGW